MSADNSAAGSQNSPARPPLAPRGEKSVPPLRPLLAPRGGKSGRLLKHADFQRVYQQGRRQFTGNMTVFFLRRDAAVPGGARVGLTVGKVLGGAVERNRIKRRMREAARLAYAACEGPIDIVFNPRKSVLTMPFAELSAEVERGLRLAAQRARQAEAK